MLQARDYVNKIEGRFRPTILGRRLVDKLLHPVFDDILDVEYTARMEDQLDEIEKGKADYKETLATFYKSFKKDLKRAAKEMPNFKEGQPTGVRPATSAARARWSRRPASSASSSPAAAIPTATTPRSSSRPTAATEELDETCENCGRPMVVKRGRFGMFLACTGYPECKTTRKIIATKQGVDAPPSRIRSSTRSARTAARTSSSSRAGSASSRRAPGYPECKYVKQKSTGVVCPKDGGDVVERKSRRGKVFYGCANYPKCDFTLWNKPILEPCPKCGGRS